MIAICIVCTKCKRSFFHSINELEGFSVECETCGERLVFSVKGFVYILSNIAMPNIVKIGFTRRSVTERLKELNSTTSLPEAFVVEAFWVSNAPAEEEKIIHNELHYSRKNKNREFFHLSVLKSIKNIQQILKREPDYVNDMTNQVARPESEQVNDIMPAEVKQVETILKKQHKVQCLRCEKIYLSDNPTICPHCRTREIKIYDLAETNPKQVAAITKESFSQHNHNLKPGNIRCLNCKKVYKSNDPTICPFCQSREIENL